ncbi:MAG: isoamylase early set domain-containing protein [Rhodothermales bacterium]
MIEKKPSTKGNTVRVKFELPGDVAENSVAVVGDFNDWDENVHEMKYVKSRNVWSTTITLPANNSYQFRYLVDGEEWQNEEQADGVAGNPYFSENSVIEL